tara:strand:+ start:192 stop:473 length:282 start_codon:yes stop_codon:yes gene_type:complete
MKISKELNAYCPKCNTHTVHKVSQTKKGQERKQSLGARKHAIDKKGYGGQKFPEQKKKVKTTKKVILKLECITCKYIVQKNLGRLRKIEIKTQ